MHILVQSGLLAVLVFSAGLKPSEAMAGPVLPQLIVCVPDKPGGQPESFILRKGDSGLESGDGVEQWVNLPDSTDFQEIYSNRGAVFEGSCFSTQDVHCQTAAGLQLDAFESGQAFYPQVEPVNASSGHEYLYVRPFRESPAVSSGAMVNRGMVLPIIAAFGGVTWYLGDLVLAAGVTVLSFALYGLFLVYQIIHRCSQTIPKGRVEDV
ncbi:MAG: hypothetical protein ACR2PT_12695 [Endozoicomonas sp.]